MVDTGECVAGSAGGGGVCGEGAPAIVGVGASICVEGCAGGSDAAMVVWLDMSGRKNDVILAMPGGG